MDVRVAVVEYLAANAELAALFGPRVFPGIRPQDVTGTALVYRVAKTERGETLTGDSAERLVTMELVVWARGVAATIAAKDALADVLHAPTALDMGDIEMDRVAVVDEYDGDRVTDLYSDAGECAITLVVELQFLA